MSSFSEEERGELKDFMKVLLAEIISESQEPAVTVTTPYIEEDPTIADYFFAIGEVVDIANNELASTDYTMNTSVAYELMAVLLENAVANGWLSEPDDWERIIELFHTRSGEFAPLNNDVPVGDIDIPLNKATRIVDHIIHSWFVNSEAYAPNEFTISEKMMMLRSIVVSLRNKGYLTYDPWLKTLLASMYADWQYFGGGFGSNMGSGTPPWSHG